MPKTLTVGEKHLLRLTHRDADANGWSKVSAAVMPVVKSLPRELVEIRGDDNGGFVRLSEAGNSVIESMAWLS